MAAHRSDQQGATPTILIRADASLSIGSGHVMRCRTLARELRCRGAHVSFLCRRQPGDLISLLEQEFQVLTLPEMPPVATQTPEGKQLQGRELYGAWLGCSQDQDAADCLQALALAGHRSTSWLVVDHYGLDAAWETQLLAGLAGDAAARLLVIDDLADRPHQADLLLDQNFFGPATETRYTGLVPEHCRLLLGPHYALLGPEYAQLHPLVPPRRELRRVLVFFGGVDPANLTGKTLEALMATELQHLAVDVVLGHQSLHRQSVADLVSHRQFTTLHSHLPSLAGLIVRADVAIGAGGSTTWERACLRLPSVVVTSGPDQQAVAESLAKAGELQLLGTAGEVEAQHIRKALGELWREHGVHPCGDGLTDGWGAARISIALLGLDCKLHIRSASANDEALLLRLANDEQVRANSFSPQPIATSDHKLWFQNGMADEKRLQLIAEDYKGCPLGQIRFDLQMTSDADRSKEALIDLSLDRCARGKGIATELLHLGLQAMEQHWGCNTEAVADVLSDNAASNGTFASAGFDKEPKPSGASIPPPPQSVTRWRRRRCS